VHWARPRLGFTTSLDLIGLSAGGRLKARRKTANGLTPPLQHSTVLSNNWDLLGMACGPVHGLCLYGANEALPLSDTRYTRNQILMDHTFKNWSRIFVIPTECANKKQSLSKIFTVSIMRRDFVTKFTAFAEKNYICRIFPYNIWFYLESTSVWT